MHRIYVGVSRTFRKGSFDSYVYLLSLDIGAVQTLRYLHQCEVNYAFTLSLRSFCKTGINKETSARAKYKITYNGG